MWSASRTSLRATRARECFRVDKMLEEAVDRFLAAHPGLAPAEAEVHRIVQVCVCV
jgi:hypothetical protein